VSLPQRHCPVPWPHYQPIVGQTPFLRAFPSWLQACEGILAAARTLQRILQGRDIFVRERKFVARRSLNIVRLPASWKPHAVRCRIQIYPKLFQGGPQRRDSRIIEGHNMVRFVIQTGWWILSSFQLFRENR
jgi:hypothetical protein